MKAKTATMNISLPTPLRDQLEKKVQRLGSYGSTSEYVRDLIRRDLQREAIEKVDALLLEGLQSGSPVAVTDRWWKARRAELAQHRRAKAKKPKRS